MKESSDATAEHLLRDDLEIINYLRGLAAILVSWLHLTNQYGTGLVMLSGSYGWLGVEVFFVVSGFIIPWSLRHWNKWSLSYYVMFLARRLLRVGLPYLASIALALGVWYLALMAPDFRGEAPKVSLAFFFLHISFMVPFSEYPWLQPVYWTLAYEIFFYAILGITFVPIVGSSRDGSTRVVALALVACVFVIAVYATVYWFFFLLGILTFRHLSGYDSEVATITFSAVVVGMIVLVGSPVQGATGVVAALLIATSNGLVSLGPAISGVLSWLGTISYSLYLTHVPIGGRVVNLGRRVIDDEFSEQLALSVTALALSIAVAWLFHMYVEKPAHNLSRSLKKGKGVDLSDTRSSPAKRTHGR